MYNAGHTSLTDYLKAQKSVGLVSISQRIYREEHQKINSGMTPYRFVHGDIKEFAKDGFEVDDTHRDMALRPGVQFHAPYIFLDVPDEFTVCVN